MQQCRARVLALVFAAASLAMTSFPPTASAQGLTKEAVSQRIEKAYSVKVLRIREAEDNGTPIYILTVMNPGGDFNEAFQVNTLAVDRASGNLISQYRHTATGHVFSGADNRALSTDESGAVIRQWTHRAPPAR